MPGTGGDVVPVDADTLIQRVARDRAIPLIPDLYPYLAEG